MPKISIAIATFNEETNIALCLQSIKNLADEVVVVDGGSADKTVELARKYGAKVFVTDNPQIFHINKQKAIDKATGDWILQLDADELVSKELADEIKEKTQSSEFAGYWIPRKNLFLGRFLKKGGQYPDYTLRLYKKGAGRLPQKDVHEQAVVEGKVGYLKHPLEHYSYKSFSGYLKKWSNYNLILAGQIRVELYKKPQPIKFLYAVVYLFIKPVYWFISSYIRHKGFMDSWQGFLFSLFSSLRFPAGYFNYLLGSNKNRK